MDRVAEIRGVCLRLAQRMAGANYTEIMARPISWSAGTIESSGWLVIAFGISEFSCCGATEFEALRLLASHLIWRMETRGTPGDPTPGEARAALLRLGAEVYPPETFDSAQRCGSTSPVFTTGPSRAELLELTGLLRDLARAILAVEARTSIAVSDTTLRTKIKSIVARLDVACERMTSDAFEETARRERDDAAFLARGAARTDEERAARLSQHQAVIELASRGITATPRDDRPALLAGELDLRDDPTSRRETFFVNEAGPNTSAVAVIVHSVDGPLYRPFATMRGAVDWLIARHTDARARRD